MKRKPAGLQLSPAGIKAGVWIDTGQWESTTNRPSRGVGLRRRYQDMQIEESPPLIMRGDRSFTVAEAREMGWLL